MLESLDRLRGMGARTAVDDAGSGFASVASVTGENVRVCAMTLGMVTTAMVTNTEAATRRRIVFISFPSL